MLVSSSDFETDRTDQAMPLDPDPSVPGAEADTVGVPAGSAQPSGASDFVDGVENLGNTADADADADALETPIAPAGAASLGTDEDTTEN
jgi:hypothetical protein